MISANIQDIAFGGEGVAKCSGLVVFVPFTAPGDEIELTIEKQKKSWARGKLERLVVLSPLRRPALCIHYQTCGGCQFQHLLYQAQLDVKKNFIQEALLRIGKITLVVPPIVPSSWEWEYREHITLKLHAADGLLDIGYTTVSRKEVFSPKECPIFSLDAPKIFPELRHLLSTLPPSLFGSVRLFKQSPGNYVVHLFLEKGYHENLEKSLLQAVEKNGSIKGIAVSTFHLHKDFGNVSLKKNLLGLNICYSPRSFMQNHLTQAENIYRYVFEHLSVTPTFLDLYCGTAVTTLLARKKGFEKAVGIEISKEAIKLAEENAAINGIDAVEFKADYVENILEEILNKNHPETILLNPPREGLLPAVVQALIQYQPQQIAYISCMPATLARDLQQLIAEGYEIKAICGFDLFPQTTHVETAVILTKKIPSLP